MLRDLELPSLQQRREFNKLVFLFKIAGGLVPAINSEDYLKPQREKRRIKAKQFSDYQCLNIVEKMWQIIQDALSWTIFEQISSGIPSSWTVL